MVVVVDVTVGNAKEERKRPRPTVRGVGTKLPFCFIRIRFDLRLFFLLLLMSLKAIPDKADVPAHPGPQVWEPSFFFCFIQIQTLVFLLMSPKAIPKIFGPRQVWEPCLLDNFRVYCISENVNSLVFGIISDITFKILWHWPLAEHAFLVGSATSKFCRLVGCISKFCRLVGCTSKFCRPAGCTSFSDGEATFTKGVRARASSCCASFKSR